MHTHVAQVLYAFMLVRSHRECVLLKYARAIGFTRKHLCLLLGILLGSVGSELSK